MNDEEKLDVTKIEPMEWSEAIDFFEKFIPCISGDKDLQKEFYGIEKNYNGFAEKLIAASKTAIIAVKCNYDIAMRLEEDTKYYGSSD